MPLLVIIRDVLGYAESSREAKMLIKQGKVLVDGKQRKDERYPIGIMDVIELPDANQLFRVLPVQGKRLKLHPIERHEAEFKLCRIIGKTIVKGGRTQLNFHDGRTLKLPLEEEYEYEVNEVLQLKIPEQEIMSNIKFRQGVQAIITGGRSGGKYGVIIGFGSEPGKKKTAIVRTIDKEDVRTLAQYIFAVGSDKSLISLPR
jgi:small subunit ribosomal protein S4e